MFENLWERPFHEAAVHLFELAFALSATKDSLPLESKQGPESQKIEVLPQEQTNGNRRATRATKRRAIKVLRKPQL
jgi:hypothetical protein